MTSSGERDSRTHITMEKERRRTPGFLSPTRSVLLDFIQVLVVRGEAFVLIFLPTLRKKEEK